MRQIQTQTTEEWKANRLGYIGASEIASIAFQYREDELLKNFNNVETFMDANEIFKIKKGIIKSGDIKQEYVDKGKLAETDIIPNYLNTRLPFFKFRNNVDSVIEVNDKYPTIACTPDIYMDELIGDEIFYDSRGEFITSEDGPGLIECKCTNEFTFISKFHTDCPVKYILQLQQQLLITGRKWGILAIAIAIPITEENKNDFYEKIEDGIGYKVELYLYKLYKQFVKIILESANMFWEDFKNDKCPEPKKFDRAFENNKKEILENKIETLEIFEEPIDMSDNERLIKALAIKDYLDKARKYLKSLEDYSNYIISEEVKKEVIEGRSVSVNDKLIDFKKQHRNSYICPEIDYLTMSIKNN